MEDIQKSLGVSSPKTPSPELRKSETRLSSHSQHSQTARGDSPAILMDRETLIEFGETREKLRRESDRNTILQKDNDRLRKQRDRYFKALLDAKIELPESPPSSVAGTPIRKFAQTVTSPAHSRPTTVGDNSPQQSLPTMNSLIHRGLPDKQTQPKPNAYTMSSEELSSRITQVFMSVEGWSGQFVTVPSPLKNTNIVSWQYLIAACKQLTMDDNIERTLASDFRRFVIAALVIDQLMEYFGLNLLREYVSPLKDSVTQIDNRIQGFQLRSQNSIKHELLVDRANIYTRIFDTNECRVWQSNRVATITNDIHRQTSIAIPEPQHHAARVGMHGIISELFNISRAVCVMAKEWVLDMAERNNRWEPSSMLHRNGGLHAEAGTRMSDMFVTHFGIAPAITEVAFGNSTVKPNNLHKKTVLLMPKTNEEMNASLARMGLPRYLE